MKNYEIKMIHTAIIDLGDIIDYLSRFYSSTALRQYDRIIERINELKKFPLMCEEYPMEIMGLKYRKMVVDNYLVFYLVLEDTIEIHRIINAKMDLTKIINKTTS